MDLAVQVHRLNYSVKDGNRPVNVLNNVNLTVKSGSIFGLLGPSGCGKTTLLRCLAGIVQPSEGLIRICGHEPLSDFDKAIIGFMPQELALYDEFTVLETLKYFGKLYCMNKLQLEYSIDFLISFLDLEQCQNQYVDTLSGGQQRRLSLASALVHEPKLAILDEPTVGVDPLLSRAIWHHLKVLSAKGMTIIITTHYIEEAKDATEIGFMREGSILSQGPLDKYLSISTSLEKVFLEMCRKTEHAKRASKDNIFVSRGKPDIVPIMQVKADEGDRIKSMRKRSLSIYLYVAYILLWKNWMRVRRSPHVLVYIFLMPAVQLILFCTCIGNDPMNVQLAVVNEEPAGRFSSLFLEKLPSFYLHQKRYDSMAEAVDSVKRTQSWGVLHIPRNFTPCLQRRIYDGEDVSNITIQSTLIKLYPDLTNKQVSTTLITMLEEAMSHFYLDVVDMLQLDKVHSRLPIEVSQPIYERDDHPGGFLQFMAPGIIVAIGYGMITGLTALAFVIERNKGLIERTLFTGASINQILLASFIFHAIIVLGQNSSLVAFSFYFFEIRSHGPVYLVYSLLFLQGLAGTAFGLLIVSLCLNESGALGIIVGTLYPNLIVTGILWPLEAVPPWFRWFCYTQPGTMAIISMRNIILRGWDITEPGVYHGFLTTIAFTIVFMTVASYKFKV